TPTMLLTGEADYRTPIAESEQYYQALKLRKVDTALVRIPEASHGIASRPSNLIAKVLHIIGWFDRHSPSQQDSKHQASKASNEATSKPLTVSRTLAFGPHSKQRIDLYTPEDADAPLPVVLFVHGGGWTMGENTYVQEKPRHFVGSKYVFASTGYRLVPEVSVKEQAKDIGEAVRALVANADALSIDASRIVLMGHSAGAHLAALVATDPVYAGKAFAAIKGVILLDGPGYDLAVNIESASTASRERYLSVFGDNPSNHRALSPLTYVGGRDVPNWLALYVADRDDKKQQALSLVNALSRSGAKARALPIEGTDHSRMSTDLGTHAGADQTSAVDTFLQRLFGTN
ncbi:MAG: alpha/beta fold hydrolase, partial [Myxococcota bacterium]